MVVSRTHAERFRDLVSARLGLHFDDGKLDDLAAVLVSRAHARRLPSVESYFASLDADETAALAERLTVGETYFFRYREQFDAFAEVALPAALARGAPRILSAGCATGDEPYTLAIFVREHGGGGAAAIHAFDVNPAAIARAAQARYSSWSLRETPPPLRARYFRTDGSSFALHPDVRAMVRFEQRNLVEDDPSFWAPDAFDVVFCRNVLMYFTPETMRAVVARIARALAPGGFFFLGHAETLRGISHDFHLRHTHDTFYYQRREPRTRATSRPPDAASAATLRARCRGDARVSHDASWVDAIGAVVRAHRRAREPRPAALVSHEAAWRRARPATCGRAASRSERFADAHRALLRALPSCAKDNPDASCCDAVLLTNGGRAARGRARVRRASWRADELNAGAHYLMALCREHAGDRAGALEHDQIGDLPRRGLRDAAPAPGAARAARG